MDKVSLADAQIRFDGRVLVLRNARIERVVDLRDNLFATTGLTCLASGRQWAAEQQGPALSFGGDEEFPRQFRVKDVRLRAVEEPLWEQAHLLAEVEAAGPDGALTRFYQIYPDCPATVCWTDLEGEFAERHEAPTTDVRGRRMMPHSVPARPGRIDRHDSICLAAKHLRIRNVAFTDCTDINDNLVHEEERCAWGGPLPWRLEGNLVFAESLVTGGGVFLLKEAPVLADQPDHPDADFLFRMDGSMLAQAGWGMRSEDVRKLGRMPSWRTVMGVYPEGAWQDSLAVKRYLRCRCRMKPRRDWLITCNQWGDRREGRQLSEEWVRREIDACAEMGVEAYLIDAGWQAGDVRDVYRSVGEGSKPFYGDRPFWAVDSSKFPGGLEPVAEYARERGVDLAMWFNTDFTDENSNWERDAATLMDIQRRTGAVGLKIDDVWMLTRRAELRNRAMLERVYRECNGEASFHLDITAGARWGYFMTHHLGVLYVENRYTHWRNYFPYRTHRNLWELSRYLLPQRLQFEFLNNSPDRMAPYMGDYPEDDPFRPSRYSMDYLFATVMFSNPIAFLEATALDAGQREELRRVIAAYRPVRYEMFRGEIIPLGEKPSGRSLTGFQSHDERTGKGFVCVYREATNHETLETEMMFSPGTGAMFRLIAGEGEAEAGSGCVRFRLPRERSYALFRYR